MHSVVKSSESPSFHYESEEAGKKRKRVEAMEWNQDYLRLSTEQKLKQMRK